MIRKQAGREFGGERVHDCGKMGIEIFEKIPPFFYENASVFCQFLVPNIQVVDTNTVLPDALPKLVALADNRFKARQRESVLDRDKGQGLIQKSAAIPRGSSQKVHVLR